LWLAVSAVLIVFLGLAGLSLDRLYRQQSENALRELLDAQMVALIAAAEPAAEPGTLSADGTTEPRLMTPGSGLFAEIRRADAAVVWRSGSTAGAFVDLTRKVPIGQVVYADMRSGQGEPLLGIWRGLRWQFAPGAEQDLVFAVAVSRRPSQAALAQLRRSLLAGSLVFAAMLLGVLLWVTRSTTRPLRQLESEIAAVEAGERQALSEGFPREVAGVAAGLNMLLTGERKRIERYRNNLADLAHSLKTPLAVIRAQLRETGAGEDERIVAGEVDRMNALIDRHLKRAAMSGGVVLGQSPVDINAILVELRATLLRAYSNKDLLVELQPAPGAMFLGDRTDLLEMAGNLLDNACKWCRSRVRVAVLETAQHWQVQVEDDGPGMAPSLLASGPERGQRADEATPGHGFGLAMVRDTVESYGGELQLGASALGGARASLLLPRYQPKAAAPGDRPLDLLASWRRR
jgi:two-component system sensor histidine kinase PhoQ